MATIEITKQELLNIFIDEFDKQKFKKGNIILSGDLKIINYDENIHSKCFLISYDIITKKQEFIFIKYPNKDKNVRLKNVKDWYLGNYNSDFILNFRLVVYRMLNKENITIIKGTENFNYFTRIFKSQILLMPSREYFYNNLLKYLKEYMTKILEREGSITFKYSSNSYNYNNLNNVVLHRSDLGTIRGIKLADEHKYIIDDGGELYCDIL